MERSDKILYGHHTSPIACVYPDSLSTKSSLSFTFPNVVGQRQGLSPPCPKGIEASQCRADGISPRLGKEQGIAANVSDPLLRGDLTLVQIYH